MSDVEKKVVVDAVLAGPDEPEVQYFAQRYGLDLQHFRLLLPRQHDVTLLPQKGATGRTSEPGPRWWRW